jgi:hypothetical protein
LARKLRRCRAGAQGSYLFYFRDAAAARCQGVIPLEGARVAAARAGRAPGEPRVRIDLEPDPLLRHYSYTLAADSDDMQARGAGRAPALSMSLCALAAI